MRIGHALALVLLTGCEDDDPAALPNFGAPPLYDEELAKCEVRQDTTYLGLAIESKIDAYDAQGRRVEEAFDPTAADTWPRVHTSTWDGLDLVRVEGTDSEDEDYTWLETFERAQGIVLSRRWSGERPVGPARERWDVLSTYTYDAGLLVAIDDDDGADGKVDEHVVFDWSTDAHHLVERHDDIDYVRTLDSWVRVLTEVQKPADPELPVTSAAFVYDAEHETWPRTLYVDLDANEAPEVTIAWTYDCP